MCRPDFKKGEMGLRNGTEIVEKFVGPFFFKFVTRFYWPFLADRPK